MTSNDYDIPASEYRFFTVAGKSAVQMAQYDTDVKDTAKKIKAFVEKHGADKMQMSGGSGGDTSSSGLIFLEEIPIGWKPFLGISTKPDCETPIGADANAELHSLWWNGPSTYLCSGVPTKHEDGRNLFPLAKEHNDGWIIASPIAKKENEETFIPEGAIEMTLEEYTESMGYKGDTPAPNTEKSFNSHPVELEFPFKPNTDRKICQEQELHRIAFNSHVSIQESFPVPLKKAPTFMEKQKEKYTWLKKLTL